MILSTKTNNAILALIYIARKNNGLAMQVSEIAESEKLSKRNLEGIFLDLRKAGILKSKLGKTGGYILSRKPNEITLLDIVQVFERINGLFINKDNVDTEFTENENLVQLEATLEEIRLMVVNKLKATTLEDLMELKNNYNYSI